jgi:UDP-galactopyranose mutase
MSNYLIVGSGLSGCVIAERLSHNLENKITIIDKRNHIGGNCYDYKDAETGILMNKYGAHIFHTNDESVWEYINKFSDWIRWDHKVYSFINNQYIPLPININTINNLFQTHLTNESEMKIWLDDNREKTINIKNSEDFVLNKLGKELYNKIFKYYTIKQWNKDPKELDTSVLSRIPIRYNFDNRYFTDKYQVLPKYGYTKFIENLICKENINLKLNCDFFNEDINKNTKIIFTGPIDTYYKKFNLLPLEYRSINFVKEYYNYPFYQINSVINYPTKEYIFTRIVEYKHFLNQNSDKTVIVKEISTDKGEPYYPIPTESNKILYDKYKELSDKENGIYFLGRLGTYKYLNMDEAIKNAIEFSISLK